MDMEPGLINFAYKCSLIKRLLLSTTLLCRSRQAELRGRLSVLRLTAVLPAPDSVQLVGWRLPPFS